MSESKRCAKCSLTLLVVSGILGGVLVGSSLSQDARRANEPAEVGRYQYVNGGAIFDTKTARLWRPNGDKWVRDDAPWEENQKPKPQPKNFPPELGHP